MSGQPWREDNNRMFTFTISILYDAQRFGEKNSELNLPYQLFQARNDTLVIEQLFTKLLSVKHE